MSKGTKIDYMIEPASFSADIKLDSGDIFIAYAEKKRYSAEELEYIISPKKLSKTHYDVWEVEFQDEKSRTDISPKGKGVAVKLFAALTEFFKEFLKKRKPEVIYFSGSGEHSKMKLYKTIAKQIEKKGPYEYFQTQEFHFLFGKNIGS